MIVATLRIVVPKSKVKETEKTLRLISGPLSVEPGCSKSYYFNDLEDIACFAIFQEWSSETQLQRFLKSDLYRKILALMDLSKEPPEVCFYKAGSCEGLEVVRKAREWR